MSLTLKQYRKICLFICILSVINIIYTIPWHCDHTFGHVEKSPYMSPFCVYIFISTPLSPNIAWMSYFALASRQSRMLHQHETIRMQSRLRQSRLRQSRRVIHPKSTINPIEEQNKIDNSKKEMIDTCIICLDEDVEGPISNQIYDHGQICNDCILSLMEKGLNCPLCRSAQIKI